jgi:hypothetical protein
MNEDAPRKAFQSAQQDGDRLDIVLALAGSVPGRAG